MWARSTRGNGPFPAGFIIASGEYTPSAISTKLISADRFEPGMRSVTLVTGLATGFGTVMCHGSMLKFFGCD